MAQLITRVKKFFIRKLKEPILGYGSGTTLKITSHLFTTYGKISDSELELNESRMTELWTSTDPIETEFHNIKDGINFFKAGGNTTIP